MVYVNPKRHVGSLLDEGQSWHSKKALQVMLQCRGPVLSAFCDSVCLARRHAVVEAGELVVNDGTMPLCVPGPVHAAWSQFAKFRMNVHMPHCRFRM